MSTNRGALSRLGGSSRTTTGKSFVSKAMKEEKVTSSVTANVTAEAEMEQRKQERDFETPAFLRKKLMNS
jgi:hypothetical protein